MKTVKFKVILTGTTKQNLTSNDLNTIANQILANNFEGEFKVSSMINKAMERKIQSGEAIDLCNNDTNADNDYILLKFVEDKDYCDSKLETWIWSIGKHVDTGQILASTSNKFYQNKNYECLFLR